jgi:hypothetical protein
MLSDQFAKADAQSRRPEQTTRADDQMSCGILKVAEGWHWLLFTFLPSACLMLSVIARQANTVDPKISKYDWRYIVRQLSWKYQLCWFRDTQTFSEAVWDIKWRTCQPCERWHVGTNRTRLLKLPLWSVASGTTWQRGWLQETRMPSCAILVTSCWSRKLLSLTVYFQVEVKKWIRKNKPVIHRSYIANNVV